MSLTFQGGQFIFGVSAWTVTRPAPPYGSVTTPTSYNDSVIASDAKFKPTLFAGLTLGIDTATPAEAMHDSLAGGGSVADGRGGSGGVYTGPGDSPRPYGGVTWGMVGK